MAIIKEVIYTREEPDDAGSPKSVIAQLCELNGLKQTELAKRFGIPLRTVQDWHAGRRVPPDYVVRMMVELLGHDRRQ